VYCEQYFTALNLTRFKRKSNFKSYYFYSRLNFDSTGHLFIVGLIGLSRFQLDKTANELRIFCVCSSYYAVVWDKTNLFYIMFYDKTDCWYFSLVIICLIDRQIFNEIFIFWIHFYVKIGLLNISPIHTNSKAIFNRTRLSWILLKVLYVSIKFLLFF
jgi:hypothetical protein